MFCFAFKSSFTSFVLLCFILLANCTKNPVGVEKNNISNLIPDLKKQCYIIGLAINDQVIGVGSGFAISEKRIMTNAHVVNALVDFAQQYGTNGYKFIAVRDGGRVNHEYSFELDSFAVHPEYNSDNQYTYDFGIVTIKSGRITDYCDFENESALYSLREGDDIYTIGFPGETNDQNTIQPIATYKNGSISALRPFNQDATASNQYTNVVIQHNFNSTGGTSGSPVFNSNGKVIGIICSAEFKFIKNSDGTTDRLPVAAIAYAIRIDQQSSINNTFLKAFGSIKKVEQFANLTIVNNSTDDIWFFSIKQSSSDDWNNDILGDDIIASGYSYKISNIPAGQYDLGVLNEDLNKGKVITKQIFESGESYTWTISSLEYIN